MDISEEIMARVRAWLSYEYDKDTRERVQWLLENDLVTLQESFSGDLEFGTGGMRGIMGVGPNRLNIYTIGRATQGLANYLQKNYPTVAELRVAIAYDCRNNSARFAEVAADTLAANGIRVFLYESLRPTPQLSFTVRTLSCHAGIVITASHNPKEYNGYKVYWGDGAQVVPPHDKGIIDEVRGLENVEAVKHKGDPSLIVRIGREIDEVYLSTLLDSPFCREKLSEAATEMGIVYTPIHGTGATLIPQVLRRRGFKNVHVVTKQRDPDGDFKTVVSPNPEEPSAMSLAVALAEETQATLVLGTDPDADRVGVYARDAKGELVRFDGNQIAILLAYFVLEREQELKRPRSKRFMVRTIVTTPLLDALAQAYKVEMRHVLTGFKYIAEEIAASEGKCRFVMGAEESHGYLVGDKVRDKDAVQSCLLLAEFAAWALAHGTNLCEELQRLYAKYGYWKHAQRSLVRKGDEGKREIEERMRLLRTTPLTMLGEEKVVRVTDYLAGRAYNPQNQEEYAKPVLHADVMEFETEGGSRLLVRPSGTEPKIKYYLGMRAPRFDAQVETTLTARIEQIFNTIAE